MNIQSYIDRKRIAGAREHEGRQTDWAGWDYQQCWTAVVGELLDACAYCEHIREIGTKEDDFQLIREADEMIVYLTKALQQFGWNHLEAACQEAEQEADKSIVNCPYCNTELLLWDELPDNSYIPDDVNVICCKECCEEFNVIIHNQFDFEVKQEAKQ